MKTSKVLYQGQENQLLALIRENQYSQVILVTDANTNGFCAQVLKNLCPDFQHCNMITIPQGEQNKTLDVCYLIWLALEKIKADRSCLLINLGGGMLSDLSGFAASVYKRGIAFANIPTTLLSMVDACIGGKTGINFNGVKNNIGAFTHPEIIYINPIFLKTLPERILNSGFAEMIKHTLISSAEDWDHKIRYRKTADDFITLDKIKKSLEIKMNLVGLDEYDQGVRQALNFGHSMGHAIESYFLQSPNPLLHGEAVMLGMYHELKISEYIFQLPSTVLSSFELLMKSLFPQLLELYLNRLYTFEDIQPFLLQDKKNKSGVRMSLLKNPGHCVPQSLVGDQCIKDSFYQ